MKIVYNNILPIKGFSAINILGILFVRNEYKGMISETTINHESIHSRQILETSIVTAIVLITLAACNVISWWWLFAIPVGFYLRYIAAWLLQILLPPYDEAYNDIAFEEEAYDNQGNLDYLNSRKPFTWVKYIFKDIS